MAERGFDRGKQEAVRAAARFMGVKLNVNRSTDLVDTSKLVYEEDEAPSKAGREASHLFFQLFRTAGITISQLEKMSRVRFERSYYEAETFYKSTEQGQKLPLSPWHVLGAVKRSMAFYQDLALWEENSALAKEYQWHRVFKSQLTRSLYAAPQARNRYIPK